MTIECEVDYRHTGTFFGSVQIYHINITVVRDAKQSHASEVSHVMLVFSLPFAHALIDRCFGIPLKIDGQHMFLGFMSFERAFTSCIHRAERFRCVCSVLLDIVVIVTINVVLRAYDVYAFYA